MKLCLSRPLIGVCLIGLLGLLGACGSVAGTQPGNIQEPSSMYAAFAPALRTVAMPRTQTICPAAGMARAAITAPLVVGMHQNLVYMYNSRAGGMLKRYDTNAMVKKTMVKFEHVIISDAQISTDGQFILFVVQRAQYIAIQLVRMDGQGLQTLYCVYNRTIPAMISELLWSPDQQMAVFTASNPGGAPGAPIIQQLDLRYGMVRTLFAPSSRAGYHLQAWRGNGQVYMTGYYTNGAAAPHDVYVLDISTCKIKAVAQIEGYGWDMNLTPDGSELVLSQSANSFVEGQPLAPSIISAQSAKGGPIRIFYGSHVYSVTQARVISPTTLLFIIGGMPEAGMDDPQVGLWSIHLDGGGLTHLVRVGQQLNSLHTPWASLSRDGRLYAVTGHDELGPGGLLPTKIYYGSLDGGRPVLVATTGFEEGAAIVGWASM